MHSRDIPNLFLVGPPKCGTTFLQAALVQSRHIFGPVIKEPQFFVFAPDRFAYSAGKNIPVIEQAYNKNAYMALFKEWREEAFAIDASANQLHGRNTAKRIFDANPDAKIIAVLREPVARAYSHYLMMNRWGAVPEPLEEALEIEQQEIQALGEQPSALQYSFVRQSLYFDAVKSYLDVFGPANVRIYHFADVTQNLPMILKDLEEFLSVPLSYTNAIDGPKNSFRAPRSQAASRLLAFYHTLPIKPLVNQITPRKLRNFVRTWFHRLNSKETPKPPLSDVARARILDLVGDDYPRTLQLVRDRGSLFEIEKRQPPHEWNDR
ncbi:sulfotransferase domain-containing protein [Celeribacter baekdonensis]|uniref:Sulfotransferase domain-containing protein n=1 Tax=Celeribacter baekdonensis TaxID=875171 RepID=A0A2R4M8Z5_9RHOB|nr:sulfotransferase domain-containing protein [Celeribacter baekdonensis]AVW93598.1 hypothetical protein DA792_21400 [Celeribacter baekdonensis]